jgi:tRNA(Leu) C34 or U34 (ribose-2'-O)-methylase TrmL
VFCLQENTNGGGETGPDAAGFEGAPQSALVSVETFLRTSRESLRSQRAIEDAWLWRDAMASGCDLTGDRITGVVAIGEDDSIVGHGGVSGNGQAAWENTNTNTDGGARGGDASSGKSAMSLQKKVEGVGSGLNPESEVYLDGFDSMALALRDMAEDVDRAGIRTDTDTNRRPPGLVVIASLVDKIPNLAGLARTCEVLGAEALVMADRDRTVAHKDFTAVSVTAEQWLPIRDVSIAGLVPYLLRLRREGYTLVGLEQTRGAVDVNDFEFPRKTALVLGREREGIDADVLSVLDTCVVIEQKGMIRSLNVHVSASVAIAAYARAH